MGMEGYMTPDPATKKWTCRHCGQTIGDVVRVGRIRRLIFAGAQIEGFAVIPCPGCGMQRIWRPGQEAMELLLSKNGTNAVDDPELQGDYDPCMCYCEE